MTFQACVDLDEEIDFLTIELVDFCHEQALLLHPDNLTGTRDRGALESAIHRPQQYLYYEGVRELIYLAAVLWHGIGRAHGYNDANKRTAFVCAFTFLEINGVELAISDPAEPGHFINALFELGDDGKDRFEIPELENYLRMRCRWIEEE